MRKLTLIFLWMVVFSIPWEEAVSLADFGTLSRVFGYLALGAGVACIFSQMEPFRELDHVLVVAAAFAIWTASTAGWSEDWAATLERSIVLVRVMGLAWLIWQFVRTRREQLRLMQAYVMGCCISISSLLAAFYEDGGGIEGGRYRGASMNENGLAVIFAFSVLFALYLASSELARNGVARWLYRLYCPLAAIAALLTGSRGGVIVLLCGLAGMGLSIIWNRAKTGLVFIALIAAGIYASSILLPEATSSRLAETGTEIRYGTWSDRRYINAVAMDIFWTRPIHGVGGGNFGIAKAMKDGRADDAHNTFTGVAVETGVIGFALFFSIPAILLVRIQHLAIRERFMFTTALVMWLLVCLSATWDYGKTTWFLFGMCLSQVPQYTRAGRRVMVAKGGRILLNDSGWESWVKPGNGSAGPGNRPPRGFGRIGRKAV